MNNSIKESVIKKLGVSADQIAELRSNEHEIYENNNGNLSRITRQTFTAYSKGYERLGTVKGSDVGRPDTVVCLGPRL
ncbi:MAG: hypothetical protein GY874_14220 [Desulfobacteraceae bacterium]|nr:hypothetical protein [Desulfobacteraceae bacterium]